jgi:3-isopropylmalate dehydrogenase
MKILILPGDGIGPEIVGQAVRVLEKFKAEGEPISLSHGQLGGAAFDAHGHPYPEATQQLA